MDDTGAQVHPDEQSSVPETPEDVAILYSWANMPGAKYRDFSASRREYRAQQRAKTAEQQRQAELEAARELEATAQREFQEAQRIREESRRAGFDSAKNPDGRPAAYELVRRVEEQALREREEAKRRQESAEHLRLQAQKARSEMLEARKRAEEQAARYAEAAAQYHDEVQAEADGFVPGETTDPYYYTGQVDPAYFASTPGVRTAQATRISTERRAYVYPMHPGSDDHDSGTLQAYRSGTTFAPSPTQSNRIQGDLPHKDRQRHDIRDELCDPGPKHADAETVDVDPTQDDYYDGGPSTKVTSDHKANGSSISAADRDLLIRPVARTPDPLLVEEESASAAPIVPSLTLQQEEESSHTIQTAEAVPNAPKQDPQQSRKEVGGEKLAALESFASDSELFVPPSAQPSAEFLIQALPAPFAKKVRGDVLPADRIEPNRLRETLDGRPQMRRRDLPQDSRVRTNRRGQMDYVRPVPNDAKAELPALSHWLKPEQPPARRFDPDRVRSVVAAKSMRPGERPLTRYANLLEENRRRTNRNPSPHNESRSEEFDPSHAVQPRETFHSQRTELHRTRTEQTLRSVTPPRDTLQQSRERVASRWFALKGRMDFPQEIIDGRHAAAIRTPTLCVMSLSGGVGKTSIVASLGRALSSMGEKILLADTNQHGLLPYYFGARDLRPRTIRTFTPPAGSRDAPVLLLNYEIAGMSNDQAGQRRVLEDMGRRAKNTHRIVIDLGTEAIWLARRLARLYPWVLVPVAPDMNSVVTTQVMEGLFAGVVGADGHPVKPYYVLNQFDPALPLHLDVREVLRQSLGDRLLQVMLHRSPAVSEALAEGMTVIDYAPNAAVTEDYINLANWLRNVSAAGTMTTMDARWSER